MIDFQSNFESFGKRLPQQFFKDVSFATTRAIDRAVVAGVKSGEALAAKELQTSGLSDTGGPLVPGLAKTGKNRGLVRGWSPNRAQVALNLRKGFADAGGKYSEARVFIVNDKDPAKRGRPFDLVDEMHPLVFGGLEKDTNIIPGDLQQRGIITPTLALMEGLKGRGRLKEFNRFGNLPGLRNHLANLLRSTDSLGKMYLNVPINNTNRNTLHLKPGLYFKGREVISGQPIDGRSRRTLTRSTAKPRRGRTRVNTYQVMILSYSKSRVIRHQFPFDDVVAKEMRKVLISIRVFYEELGSAFSSSLAGGRYGTRKFL